MRTTGFRSMVLYILLAAFLGGLGYLLYQFVVNGSQWAMQPYNGHVYSENSTVKLGDITDRDGNLLATTEDGARLYSQDETVRRSLLHTVGDPYGYISTSVQYTMRAQLSGYNIITGLNDTIFNRMGSDIALTIDQDACVAAYNALGGKNGAVIVYNYETGEILAKVSTPTFDPNAVPEDLETNEAYKGVYLDNTLSGSFTPGSIFKIVTAAAAMRAMEEGLFELEQPVAELLPAYRDAYLLKDGARVKPESVMTVRHLMTMSAGLNYNFNRASVRRANERRGGCATTVEIAEALAEDPLDFEPGARFQYSLCHDVLAAVIEKASGMTFRDYVRTRILDPLGMKDTDFDTTDAPRALSALYSWDGEKKRVVLQPSRNNFVLSPAYYSGGAGLCATASDYAAFADAMACGGVGGSGARILKDASIERLRAERLSSFSAIQQFSCTCGPDYGYGLGVRTRSRFDHGVVSALGGGARAGGPDEALAAFLDTLLAAVMEDL